MLLLYNSPGFWYIAQELFFITIYEKHEAMQSAHIFNTNQMFFLNIIQPMHAYALYQSVLTLSITSSYLSR